MNEEITLDVVKKRTVKSIVALTGRTFFLQLTNRAGDFILTIFLGVTQYGVFWIVSAVINFLAYFSDIGLAAALIQKKGQISENELKTTFTIQQALVLSILLVLFLVSPAIGRFYNLSQESMWLLYALGFSFFLSSLKTIPSILLERKIDFAKLIIPQIAESIIFNVTAVYLAWQGFGVTSFTIAVLARGMIGATLMYMIQPWKVGFSMDLSSIRRLFTFGVPYQANTFLALIKDDGLNIVLGGILGASGMGLLGWAQRWAQAPLRFFMDQIIKVSFPAFSRIQDQKAELSYLLSRSIFFISLLVFPTLIGLLTLVPMLTQVIPRYEKWQPALFAITILGISVPFAAVTTPLTNMLNAIGKINITFRLMIMWTFLTWLLVPPLAFFFGVNGAALGFTIVGLTSVVAMGISKKFVRISLFGSAGKPLVASILMGGILLFVRETIPVSVVSIFILIFLGIISYSLLIFLLVGGSILRDFKRVLSEFKNE
ncbi:MAG: oligosaccharide flippase family protein [Patescibacteria group bacterium]